MSREQFEACERENDGKDAKSLRIAELEKSIQRLSETRIDIGHCCWSKEGTDNVSVEFKCYGVGMHHGFTDTALVAKREAIKFAAKTAIDFDARMVIGLLIDAGLITPSEVSK